MKKLLFFAVILLFYGNSAAQNTAFSSSNALRIAPVEFVRAEFKVSYERYFNDRKSSIMITPMLIYKSEEGDNRLGWQAMLQYRYFISHLNESNGNSFLGLPNLGLYAGIYGLYLNYNDEYTIDVYSPDPGQNALLENKRSIQSQEGGALVGIQLDLTKRFVVDFYIGGGVRVSSETNSLIIEEDYYTPSRGGIYEYEYNGVKPTIGFMVGLLF